MRVAFHQTSAAFLASHPEDKSGTTAVAALVAGGALHVANVGDSRAVLRRVSGVVEAVTTDHSPFDSTERARIEAAGGTVDDFFDGVAAPDGSGYLKCARS